jgi:hypothetical protein
MKLTFLGTRGNFGMVSTDLQSEGGKLRTITAGLMLLLALPAHAQERRPIIDMHLHASAADENGPPPLALCVPIPEFPVRDPRRPWSSTTPLGFFGSAMPTSRGITDAEPKGNVAGRRDDSRP